MAATTAATRTLSAQMTLDTPYQEEYGTVGSPEHTELANTLKTSLDATYRDGHPDDFIDTSNYVFTAGSTVCSYDINLAADSTLAASALHNTLQTAVDDNQGAIPDTHYMASHLSVADPDCASIAHCTSCNDDVCDMCEEKYVVVGEKECQLAVGADLYPWQFDDAVVDASSDIFHHTYISLTENNLFELNCERYTRLYVSRHGFISFGKPYEGISSTTAFNADNSATLVAPLMALTQGNGNAAKSSVYISVYSHVNDESDPEAGSREATIWDLVRKDAEDYGNDVNFSPSLVIVVTYNKMISYPFDATKPENTFQVILAMDGKHRRSFILFRYHKLNWSGNIQNIAGVQMSGNAAQTFTIGVSTTPLMFNIHLQPSNVMPREGDKGVYYRKTSQSQCEGESYSPYLCLNWFNQQDLRSITRKNRRTPQCPCNFFQIIWSTSFFVDYPCSYSATRRHARQCCYTPLEGFWLPWLPITFTSVVLDVNQSPFLMAHPFLRPEEHEWEDVKPREWCCEDSEASCHYYRQARPLQGCADYTPPFWSWFFGDPHIVTPDGKTYTFNGIGEYVFLKTPFLNIHIRAQQARDADGQLVRASIFTAAVMQSTGTSKIQVEVAADGTSLEIYSEPAHPDEADLTAWYEGAAISDSLIFDGGLLSLNKNNGSLGVRFTEDEVELTCKVGAGKDLSVSVGVTQRLIDETTYGLLGNINRDPSDDYITPDGTSLPDDANEQSVYSNFGQRWLVNLEDTATSLFIYRGSDTAATFAAPDGYEPQFAGLDELSEEQQNIIRDTCGDDYPCMYDYALTNDASVAEASAESSSESEEVSSGLENMVPSIVLEDDTIQVTVGSEVTVSVTVNDTDDDTFTFEVTKPDSATFTVDDSDDKSATLTWTASDRQQVIFTIGGKDSLDVSAVRATLNILLCDCSGHGDCNFDVQQPNQVTNETFRLVECDCNTGYDGNFCENDRDGCADGPCHPLQNCTDVAAAEEENLGRGFQCTECPDGYLDSDGICIDVDECADTDNPVCTSDPAGEGIVTCVNTVGSYSCSCAQGYKLNPSDETQCIDVNECTSLTDNCEQICDNTNGSFTCSCYEGYTASEETCTQDQGTETTCEAAGLTCSDFCSGNGVCGCPSGMTLQQGSTENCEDIDECTTEDAEVRHQCSEHAQCVNTDQGYNCTCNAGYTLDEDGRGCTGCEAGMWGENCANICTCLTPGDCNPATGCDACAPGWQVPTCQVDINECEQDANRCGDNGACVNSAGSFTCNCDEGYLYNPDAGCEFDDYCTHPNVQRCFNGATCAGIANGFECSCVAGYNGTQCETEIDECENHECAEGSACSDQLNGYTCICPQGFGGDRCDTDINECDSDPCMNGGACENGASRFDCDCPEAWTGPTCQDVNDCLDDPCGDNGSCTDGDDAYTCSCSSGWTGTNCTDDIDECTLGTSGCAHICTNSAGSYTCTCHTGYEIQDDMTSCAPGDDAPVCDPVCDAELGYCGGTQEAPQCQCVDGYELATGSTTDCQDKDECASAGTNGCGENSECRNEVGGYNCTCNEGYLLQDDQRTCLLDDYCQHATPSVKCYNGGTCAPAVGNYTCTCAEGYFGPTCLEEQNECDSNPCQHGATCRDLTERYTCQCATGFRGDVCETDVDECEDSPCGNHGDCANLPGSYQCTCHAGHTGVNCEVDIDYCASHECVSGTCVDEPARYSCTCEDNFTGTLCDREVTVCDSDPCNSNGKCTTNDTPAGYVCECTPKYSGVNCTDEAEVVTQSIGARFVMNAEFDDALSNTESPEYQTLKTDLTTALTAIYIARYFYAFIGLDNFVFTPGSIQADYDVLLTEDNNVTTSDLADAVVDAINDDPFGELIPNYPVDTASVSAQELNLCDRTTCSNRGTCQQLEASPWWECTCNELYQGDECQDRKSGVSTRSFDVTMKVNGTDMTEAEQAQLLVKLGDNTTPEYQQFTDAITAALAASNIDGFYGAEGFAFSSGSIVAEFTILVAKDSDVTVSDLTSTLDALTFTYGGHSYVTHDVNIKENKSSNTSTLIGVILGAILGTFCLILAVSFCLWQTRRTRNRYDSSDDWSDTSSGATRSGALWPQPQGRHWYPTPDQMSDELHSRKDATPYGMYPGPKLHRPPNEQFVDWSVLHNAASAGWGVGYPGRNNKPNEQQGYSWNEVRR